MRSVLLFFAASFLYCESAHTMLKDKFLSKKFVKSTKSGFRFINAAKMLLGVQTSFGQEFSKKISKFKNVEKNSWKFVYILAKECRSPFNLTIFFDKNFKILISCRFEIFTKTSHLKLVGTPCRLGHKYQK